MRGEREGRDLITAHRPLPHRVSTTHWERIPPSVRALGRSGAMRDAARNHQALPGRELDGAALQIHQQLALEHEEEFVLAVMLVPVKLALEDADSRHAVVDAAQGLVPPRRLGVGKAFDVNVL